VLGTVKWAGVGRKFMLPLQRWSHHFHGDRKNLFYWRSEPTTCQTQTRHITDLLTSIQFKEVAWKLLCRINC